MEAVADQLSGPYHDKVHALWLATEIVLRLSKDCNEDLQQGT